MCQKTYQMKNWKNKLLAILFIMTIILSIVLFSCKPKSNATNLFRNYQSNAGYTKAEKLLSLKEGWFVSSYDENTKTFVIGRNILDDDNKDIRYGFCSETEVLLEPFYSNVLDIRNEHAIVVTREIEASEIIHKIGIINIKSNSFGFESGNGFVVEYDASINQYMFLDDQYIIILGGKDPKIDYQINKWDYSFAVIYDYSSSNGLLEVGRINGVNSSAKFGLNNGMLTVSINGSIMLFDINIIKDGQFKKLTSYSPFEYLGYDKSNIETTAYYLGQDYYLFTGIYMQSTEYDGYDIVKPDTDNNPQYMSIHSQIYKARANKVIESEKTPLVANKFDDFLISTLANAFQDQSSSGYTGNPLKNFDKHSVQKIYDYPIVSPSRFLSDGNSILYVLFKDFNTGDDKLKVGYQTSFEIFSLDEKRHVIENMLMPSLFVDGYGVERIDPNFGLPLRDAAYFTYIDNKQHIVLALEDNIGYDPYIVHDKVMIVERTDKTNADINDIDNIQRFGAIDVEKEAIIIPFEYDIITPSFNGYSILGQFEYESVVDPNTNKTLRYIKNINYFRFNRKDSIKKIEALSNVYAVNNGTYIERVSDKFVLYSNDGVKLIDEKFDDLSVHDTFLNSDNKVFSAYAYGIKNGITSIYKLS